MKIVANRLSSQNLHIEKTDDGYVMIVPPLGYSIRRHLWLAAGILLFGLGVYLCFLNILFFLEKYQGGNPLPWVAVFIIVALVPASALWLIQNSIRVNFTQTRNAILANDRMIVERNGPFGSRDVIFQQDYRGVYVVNGYFSSSLSLKRTYLVSIEILSGHPERVLSEVGEFVDFQMATQVQPDGSD